MPSPITEALFDGSSFRLDALAGWIGRKKGEHTLTAVGAVGSDYYLVRREGEPYGRLVAIERLRKYSWYRDPDAADTHEADHDDES